MGLVGIMLGAITYNYFNDLWYQNVLDKIMYKELDSQDLRSEFINLKIIATSMVTGVVTAIGIRNYKGVWIRLFSPTLMYVFLLLADGFHIPTVLLSYVFVAWLELLFND
jgi:hypothetical protein